MTNTHAYNIKIFNANYYKYMLDLTACSNIIKGKGNNVNMQLTLICSIIVLSRGKGWRMDFVQNT